VNQRQLLALWQQTHQKVLNERHRALFLASDEARLITMYEDSQIALAVKRSPKLADILEFLRDNYGNTSGGGLPAPIPKPPSGPARPIKPTNDVRRTRTGRSRSGASVWNPPAPYGTTDPRYR